MVSSIYNILGEQELNNFIGISKTVITELLNKEFNDKFTVSIDFDNSDVVVKVDVKNHKQIGFRYLHKDFIYFILTNKDIFLDRIFKKSELKYKPVIFLSYLECWYDGDITSRPLISNRIKSDINYLNVFGQMRDHINKTYYNADKTIDLIFMKFEEECTKDSYEEVLQHKKLSQFTIDENDFLTRVISENKNKFIYGDVMDYWPLVHAIHFSKSSMKYPWL